MENLQHAKTSIMVVFANGQWMVKHLNKNGKMVKHLNKNGKMVKHLNKNGKMMKHDKKSRALPF